MTAMEFLNAVRSHFIKRADRIHDQCIRHVEWELQFEVMDALFTANLHAYHEYDYTGSSQRCDIVVTETNDWKKLTHWIELKPLVQKMSHYKNPSKFFGNTEKSIFMEDLRKLKNLVNDAHAWFLVIALYDQPHYDLTKCVDSNSGRGSTMSLPQVVSAMRFWTKGEPITVPSFPCNVDHCHLLLWDVKQFLDQKVKLDKGTYKVCP